MSADGARRIAEGGAVLDRQSGDRVRIVGAPDLRRVLQHTRVKASAASRAALKEHMWEFFGQLVIQLVQTQIVSVSHLALTG